MKMVDDGIFHTICTLLVFFHKAVQLRKRKNMAILPLLPQPLNFLFEGFDLVIQPVSPYYDKYKNIGTYHIEDATNQI